MFYCKPHEGYMRNTKRNEWWNSDLREDMTCTCPTLQMAMKWLREVHNLHCVIDYDIILGWNNKITSLKETVEDHYTEMKTYLPHKAVNYPSYKEACEAAIQHCLENLI